MKLFLTSVAANMMDKIVTMMGKPIKGMRVVFIPTAGDPYGSNKPWMDADWQKLVDLGFKGFDFDLKGKTEKDVRTALKKADVIFVAGGNTFYLLEKARKSGFEKIIKELKNSDKIYIGSSAGSCIIGPNIEVLDDSDDRSKAALDSTEAFGLVDFVVLPHYDKESAENNYKKEKEEFGDKYKLIILKNDQMAVAENGKYKIV